MSGSDLAVAAWLLSIVPLAMLVGRITLGLPALKRWAQAAFFLLTAWFGLFLMAGVFIRTPDQDPAPAEIIVTMYVVGLIFCAPLAWRIWRRRPFADSAGAAPRSPAEPAPASRRIASRFRELAQAARASLETARAQFRPDGFALPPRPQAQPRELAPTAPSSLTVHRFHYTKRGGDPHEREVMFTSHSYYGGDLYLNGYDLERGEDRTFKADRIVALLIDMDTGEMVAPAALAEALDEVDPPFGDDRW